MNRWRATGKGGSCNGIHIHTNNNNNNNLLDNNAGGFLLDYQLLPFIMSPSPLSASTTVATKAAATNFFIPSLFGCTSPVTTGPILIHAANAAVMAAANSIPGASAAAVSVVPPQHRKLFIGGLNHETTDDQLRDYYSKWGQVVDCIVIRDPLSRNSRGFGFVTFATPEQADAAIADRPHTIGGKIVDPKRAIPREQMLQAVNCPPTFLDEESPPECKLILSGINWDFHTVDDLRDYFVSFGEVQQVEIVGHPRGYGFVVFDKRDSVQRCLAHNKQHVINGRRIECRESEFDHWPRASPPIRVSPRMPAELMR